jgi:hypothetical protein
MGKSDNEHHGRTVCITAPPPVTPIHPLFQRTQRSWGAGWTALLLLLACLALPAPSALAQPVVVHDTRAATMSGEWNALGYDYIGGSGWYGGGINHDAQDADMFELTTRTRLTRLTIDALALPAGTGMGIPSGGFLVEVFANLAGNRPAEAPVFSLLVPPAFCSLDGTFPPSPAGFGGDRAIWGIDLGGAGDCVLDPGAWWLSVTAKNDADAAGGTYRWVGTSVRLGLAQTHYRCGGIDHGNNYSCPLSSRNTLPDWRPNPSDVITFLPATLSMRIEGSVQSGGGGIGVCAADFNGSGGTTVQDILDFLAAWFASDPRADFNGAGGIGVQDIFDFLGAWFAGC